MNQPKIFAAFLSVWVATTGVSIRADTTVPPSITSISLSNNQIVLKWTNGRPTYQVQMRTGLDQNWTNVGGAITGSSTAVPFTGSQAFYRVVSDYTAQYQVTFNVLWNQAQQPVDWPADPHMTGLVGGVHSSAVHFYQEGELPTEGTRLLAEYGQKPQMLAEVGAAITNGTADFQLSGPGVRPIPGSLIYIFPQAMRRDFPLVTLLSMVGPSPDWFVGVDSLSLIDNGAWVSSKTVTVYALDAGTRDGTTYAVPGNVVFPHNVVSQITGFPALANGVVLPWATFTFTRLD